MAFRIFFLFVFILCNHLCAAIPEKPIAIIIPSYNNIDWYEKNLSSIFAQEYENFRIIYINDCSKDGTGQAVNSYLINSNIDHRVIEFDDSNAHSISEATQHFIDTVNKEPPFFTLVNNKNRNGGLGNLYRAIQSCQDKEIVVTVDGDDWLAHSKVLKQLNKIYSQNNVWLTHGTYQEYPSGKVTWSEAIPPSVIKLRTFRESKCPTHLRTFYAWLFKKIRLEDLLYEDKFFWMTWDMAMMFPMIEMACERHAFIDEVNYIYNMANQINDFKVDHELQLMLENFIRKKERYSRLRKKEIPIYHDILNFN